MAFASTVRVAALFSGGKDSTYAAYAAVQRGWELTHLLSILPEDRESMLFHVPNLHMTALLAEAMQRPLISEEADKGEEGELDALRRIDRKSTRLNSSHVEISYAVFCLKKKKNTNK